MRNTVILFSSIFLLLSFLSCKGKQQSIQESEIHAEPAKELIQPVSDELIPIVPEEISPDESDLVAVKPESKLPEQKAEVKEKIANKASPLKTTASVPLPDKPLQEPQNKKETDAKVSKSPDTVELAEADIKHTEKEKKAPKPDVSHEKWDQLLKKYVTASGKVNYKGFKSDMANFQSYLDHLSSNPPQADWSRNKIRAYWINAYNAFTVKTIIDNYPLKSIMDLGKPWDKSFINIGEKTYSLNDIEHKILRAKYFDSRIHFAVNCASFSCPKILHRAFTESNVSSQMQALAIAYINDPKHNKISAKKAELSQLFEWYKDDFTKKGSLIEYINKYSKVKLNADAAISFMPYNWNLNE